MGILILAGSLSSTGCGVGEHSSYDIAWLLGASSSFEATTEGAIADALIGRAEFRTDEEGQLVGIELIHVDDSTKGVSIVLEPRTLAERTYRVLDQGLLGVERTDETAGFTAFLTSGEHNFQATRGTLRVVQAEASYVQGSFDVQMSGVRMGGSLANDGVSLHGTFQATRPE